MDIYNRVQVNKKNDHFKVFSTSQYVEKINKILDLYHSSDLNSVVIITTDPMLRDRIKTLIKRKVPIYNHLQWDVVEEANIYDYIIALHWDTFNKREKELLISRAKKILFAIQGE